MSQHCGLRCWLRTIAAALNIGLLIALVSTGLAACGYSGSNQGSTPSTQSQPQAQVTHPPIQSHPQAQVTHPPVPVQKCGVVHGLAHLEVPPSDTGAGRAENCFWQAFQHCRPATLVFITSSVDTALIRTFTIHNHNGACSISDATQQRIVPHPPSPAGTYTCTGLVQKPDGLHFTACGKDGDVLVPAS
jgi:hypothetical protein